MDVVDPLTFQNTVSVLNVPQLRRCLDGQTYRVRLLDFIFWTDRDLIEKNIGASVLPEKNQYLSA